MAPIFPQEAMVARLAVYESVRSVAKANAVVVFAVRGCCMSHVVRQLLLGLGVGPTVVEIDAGGEVHGLLDRLAGKVKGDGRQAAVPAVFVGGRYLGGVEKVMACHINGTLVPLLKEAGALWL